MNCSHCHKPIILIPSALERSKKSGGKPADYIKLFTAHADCIIKKRNDDTNALIKHLK